MAKISDKTKEQIIADYQAGASKKGLSLKYGVSIGAVFKICNGLSRDTAELVKQQVAINTALSEKSETEVKAFHSAVDQATKHLIYFQNSALRNQKLANAALESAERLCDIEAHARITAKNKETVLGRMPETIIQNTNAQQTKIQITRREIGASDE